VSSAQVRAEEGLFSARAQHSEALMRSIDGAKNAELLKRRAGLGMFSLYA
jgi:hypothetical protein